MTDGGVLTSRGSSLGEFLDFLFSWAVGQESEEPASSKAPVLLLCCPAALQASSWAGVGSPELAPPAPPWPTAGRKTGSEKKLLRTLLPLAAGRSGQSGPESWP